MKKKGLPGIDALTAELVQACFKEARAEEEVDAIEVNLREAHGRLQKARTAFTMAKCRLMELQGRDMHAAGRRFEADFKELIASEAEVRRDLANKGEIQ